MNGLTSSKPAHRGLPRGKAAELGRRQSETSRDKENFANSGERNREQQMASSGEDKIYDDSSV
eukprot:CAMPEP_0170628178 /NCGR_PEP_ID=MMETSP0224-20130122/32502_1 /TAXON_ID=285029 /ORGANISM="Togula jolla, Strain CCCM 725" /LENGTH=62 /DNA_ID=CAMNT_0010955499 /DNA_START=168 /DNA_END=353 /DNA_ORIENTATION=-